MKTLYVSKHLEQYIKTQKRFGVFVMEMIRAFETLGQEVVFLIDDQSTKRLNLLDLFSFQRRKVTIGRWVSAWTILE